MKTKKKRQVMSLFTGCGGMDLGFEGDFATLNKKTASKEIDRILKERNEE